MTAATRAEDLSWAKAWLRYAAGNWGADGRDEDMTEEQQLEARLKRLHQRRHGAFEWLIANDARARQMAKRLGLLEAGKASWQGIDAADVRRKIRNVEASGMSLRLGHFLATALRNHAPHHLGLLPPQWLEDGDDQGAVVVPLRAAATPMQAEVKRSPVIDAEPPDA